MSEGITIFVRPGKDKEGISHGDDNNSGLSMEEAISTLKRAYEILDCEDRLSESLEAETNVR